MTIGPVYREWQPPPALARHLVCSWAGQIGDDGAAYTERVLPDGSIDIIWDGGRLFVAGPDTGPVPVDPRPGSFYVGVRFRPGMAPTILGVPASELLDLRVDAAGLLGASAVELGERLHRAPTRRHAALELESWLMARLRGSAPPDPVVEAAVAELRQRPRSISPLAAQLAMSERQLHRRFTAAVGYGPKTLDRVLRFRRFLSMAERSPQLGLARLATDAGYADQAHLSRESQRLAGLPPGKLVDVRSVQDEAAAGW